MTISFSGNLTIGSNTWVSNAQLKFDYLVIGAKSSTSRGINNWEEKNSEAPVEWETEYLGSSLEGNFVVFNEWE